jgi:hypothetical protein
MNAYRSRTLWVIEVTYKRRAGKPVEQVAIYTGGAMGALLLASETAKKLNVPRSWVSAVIFYRAK